MLISVIIATHNPDRERLRQTLDGLCRQTLASAAWEVLLVDNASTPPLDADALGAVPLGNVRILREPKLGLNHARRCGLRQAAGTFVVLVDDDNVLAPDYLEHVRNAFGRLPQVGVMGGRSLPRFERAPEPWQTEFLPLLALRDLGSTPQVSEGLRPRGAIHNEYPPFAPIGAGMALRRGAFTAWLQHGVARISDRRGSNLTSGGDNDIVMAAMRADWQAAYVPELVLTHLIPASRLDPHYLARLNYGIQKSWMQVLTVHDANPWPEISAIGASLRSAKAWFRHLPWRSPAAMIRWHGARGHFDGRVARPGPT